MNPRLPAVALPLSALAFATLTGCDDTVSIVGRRDATVAVDGADVVTTEDVTDAGRPDAPGDTAPGMDVAAMDVIPDVAPDVAPDAAPDVAPDAASDAASDADAPRPMPTPRVIVNCGTVCERPLDAVLDGMGRTVFFTAFTAAGAPGIFRAAVPAPGAMPAAPTLIVAGMGLVFPSGLAISNDDATLYVADMAADRGTTEETLGLGGVFAVAATGGTPMPITLGASVVHPTSLTVSVDGADLLVTAQRLEGDGTRTHGVFRAPRAGSASPAAMINLRAPSGISQSPGGAIVVLDLRRNGPRAATAVTVAPGGPVFFGGDLVASYPAGLAHSLDGRSILVAGAPEGADGTLSLIGPDGRPTTPATLSQGLVAPLGLHRARLADVWAIADERAGDTGQVFLLNGPL